MRSISDQRQRNVGKSCDTAVRGDKKCAGQRRREGDLQRGVERGRNSRGDDLRQRKGRNETRVGDMERRLCQL